MRYSAIAKVVVDKTVYRFDKPFDYLIPENLLSSCSVGSRVTVPFGRGNTKRMGLILEICNEVCDNKESIKNIKSILSVIDEKPLLSDEMLSIIKWLKANTFCTYFDAVKTILPFGLNYKIVPVLKIAEDIRCDILAGLSREANSVVTFLRKKPDGADKTAVCSALGLEPDANCFNELKSSGVVIFLEKAKKNMKDPTLSMARLNCSKEDLPALTKKQQAVVDLLFDVGSAGVKEITYFTGVTTSVIKALEKKHIIEIYDMPYNKYGGSSDISTVVKDDISLTDEQQKAFDVLCENFKKESANTSLLFGVTGSGKTNVFMKMADEAVKCGKSVIVMVPEISLTPQTISKFCKRYGNKVAVFHSAMPLGKRTEEWKKAESGEAVVAVGTRSAVFAPLKNLGLIVMDEEQEHTYKSEKNPRFHARDVAKLRCAINNASLILASATPSVESYCLAKSGKYSLVTLKNRYGNSVLPDVITVDMQREISSGNTGVLSRMLADEIIETLNEKKQAILLLNRRGHNTFISCPSCGHVFSCPNCSISLTYHSANHRMMCHYCGASAPIPAECPVCKNKNLRFSGAGTQRADEEIKQLFPDARVARLDADTTMRRDSFEKTLSAFANGEYDILLGTQMVAKGLDFPNVVLVGVLSADQSMYSDDFRSYEQTFSLLTQVIGRSGRGDFPGKAIVQTFFPENNIISLACNQDYECFFDQEIMTRKLMIYPPYCDIVLIGITAASKDFAEKSAALFFKLITSNVDDSIKMIILGPSAASIPKVSGKYRQRIIIKTKNNNHFRAFLDSVLSEFYKNCKNGINLFIDVNPENII